MSLARVWLDTVALRVVNIKTGASGRQLQPRIRGQECQTSNASLAVLALRFQGAGELNGVKRPQRDACRGSYQEPGSPDQQRSCNIDEQPCLDILPELSPGQASVPVREKAFAAAPRDSRRYLGNGQAG